MQKRNLDKDNYLKCEILKAMTGFNKTPKKEKTTLRLAILRRVMGLMATTSYSCEEEHMLLTLKLKGQWKPYLCHPLGAALYQLHSICSNFAGAQTNK